MQSAFTPSACKSLRQRVDECCVAAHAVSPVKEDGYRRLQRVGLPLPVADLRNVHVWQVDPMLRHQARRSVAVSGQHQPVRQETKQFREVVDAPEREIACRRLHNITRHVHRLRKLRA